MEDAGPAVLPEAGLARHPVSPGPAADLLCCLLWPRLHPHCSILGRLILGRCGPKTAPVVGGHRLSGCEQRGVLMGGGGDTHRGRQCPWRGRLDSRAVAGIWLWLCSWEASRASLAALVLCSSFLKPWRACGGPPSDLPEREALYLFLESQAADVDTPGRMCAW